MVSWHSSVRWVAYADYGVLFHINVPWATNTPYYYNRRDHVRPTIYNSVRTAKISPWHRKWSRNNHVCKYCGRRHRTDGCEQSPARVDVGTPSFGNGGSNYVNCRETVATNEVVECSPWRRWRLLRPTSGICGSQARPTASIQSVNDPRQVSAPFNYIGRKRLTL